jgi:hypothetical protein
MGASLYDDDILAWSEQQSAALRRLASRPELSNVVDWPNVIEEIECLGRSEWKGVEGELRNALAHILKGYCDPGSLSRVAWAIDTDRFLDNARSDYRASMRQQIEVECAWARAFRDATRELRRYGVAIPPKIPNSSPFTLDELLEPSFSYDTALMRLRQGAD